MAALLPSDRTAVPTADGTSQRPAQDPTDRSGGYVRRRPEATPLYAVVSSRLETFLAQQRRRERTVPRFVERELRGYLECGILAHGFRRVHRRLRQGPAGRVLL